MKAIFGRLGRLEDRYQVRKKDPLSIRVLLVHPEEGVTEVLLIETNRPIQEVPPTPEEVEEVRADLERTRAARLAWSGGAN